MKKWTESEIELLKNIYLEKSNIELSKIFNCNVDCVSNRLIKLNIHRPKEWISKNMKFSLIWVIK